MEQLLDPAELIRAKRDEILRIAAQHGAHNIRVFVPWPGVRLERIATLIS
jgi:hypothetical protein